MTRICRTCLEEITDVNFLKLSDASNGVKDELAACIPELDLDLVPQAAVCIYCANALHAAYDFKLKCLQTEEKIRKHKKGRALLDLEKIKQAAEPETFQVVGGGGIGMEVIYIKDNDVVEAGYDEGELITGDVNKPTPAELQVEPVNLFLNMSHNLSTQILMKGMPTINTPNKHSNIIDRGHSIKKKKLLKNQLNLYDKGTAVKRSFDCTHCNFTTTRALQLKHHLLSHDGKAKEQIIISPPKFNGAKVLKCELCDFIADSKMKLTLHTKNHKQKAFTCPKCSFQTQYKVALFNHVRSHTTNSPLPKVTGPIKRRSEGYVTSKNLKFETSNSIKFDKRSSSDKVKTPPESPIIDNASKTVKCPSCSYTCYSKSGMAIHIMTHTGEKPFQCTVCGYRANQKGHIDRHMLHHSGNRRYKCDSCSYNINNQYHLLKHVKVHSEKSTDSK